MDNLVSIIIPVYNSESYLKDAIDSVINQSFDNWELLIVNDGSTDNSQQIIESYDDPRIRHFQQENKGVSAARNLALANMNGIFFCFLDADDQLAKNSISSRVELLVQNKDVNYVDGIVVNKSQDLKVIKSTWEPMFRGNPIKKLTMLSPKCFFGITWMIRRNWSMNYAFSTSLTHGEDLLFYILISKESPLKYDYVSEVIYFRREHEHSAMHNMDGLSEGYSKLFDHIKSLKVLSYWETWQLLIKIKKIIFLSELSVKEVRKAVYTLLGLRGPSMKSKT